MRSPIAASSKKAIRRMCANIRECDSASRVT
jgi:hypothetical protein